MVLEGERLLSPWDCGQLANHLADQKLWDQSGYVLINEARESGWGARFPQILNLLAVPVADKTLSGWVLAFNKRRAAGRGPNDREHRPAPAAERRRIRAIPVLPFRRSGRGAPHAVRLACSASTCAPPSVISTSRTSWSG